MCRINIRVRYLTVYLDPLSLNDSGPQGVVAKMRTLAYLEPTGKYALYAMKKIGRYGKKTRKLPKIFVHFCSVICSSREPVRVGTVDFDDPTCLVLGPVR